MSFALLALTALVLPSHAAPQFDAAPLNDLGLRTMREATVHDGQGVANRLTSPVALYQALSMAANGAAGDTRAEMARTLNVVDDLEALNQANDRCRRLLTSVGHPDPEAPRVRISNAAWDKMGASPTFSFTREFVDRLKKSFDARVAAIDFKKPGAADVVNGWSNEVSAGLLPAIISAAELRELLFLLVNVTYFEGQWGADFLKIDPSAYTRDLTRFTTADGVDTHVAVIQTQGYFAHVAGPDEEVIELPFKNPEGREYVFYAVLPGAGRRPADYWDADFWAKLPARLAAAPVNKGLVRLPKFSFDYDVKLSEGDPLTLGLGLGYLFSDAADFSAMATPESEPAKVGIIKEVARVELDENGVKAAAAVMVGGFMITSVPAPPSFNMILDRPFAFAIAEKTSGALLFLGELQNPEVK